VLIGLRDANPQSDLGAGWSTLQASTDLNKTKLRGVTMKNGKVMRLYFQYNNIDSKSFVS
jgi:hypothetical protein